MLVPLASGIFAYGELSDADAVRVNVGSNVSVKKSVDDTIKLVHEQISEIEKYKGKMLENFTHMNQYVHMLQHELMKMVENEKDEEGCKGKSGKCSCHECDKE